MIGENMKRKRVFLFLTLLIMMVIFYLSNQTAAVSGNLSGSLAQELEITPEINELGATVYPIFGLPLRKWAHIGIFAALGFSCYGWLDNIYKAMIVSYLYACSDEIHQLFIEGRSCQFSDTLVDGIGIVIGIVGFLLIEFLIKKIKLHKQLKEK